MTTTTKARFGISSITTTIPSVQPRSSLHAGHYHIYDGENRVGIDCPIWLENLQKTLDVAAIFMGNIIINYSGMLANTNQDNFICANDFDVDARIGVAQDVFILGYPKGINLQNFPVWKRATIATEIQMPAYNGQPTFLVDTATKEGMSGSPVYGFLKSPYQDTSGATIITDGVQRKFLGIYSGRLGQNEMEAQLGIVWKKEAIEQIFIENGL